MSWCVFSSNPYENLLVAVTLSVTASSWLLPLGTYRCGRRSIGWVREDAYLNQFVCTKQVVSALLSVLIAYRSVPVVWYLFFPPEKYTHTSYMRVLVCSDITEYFYFHCRFPPLTSGGAWLEAAVVVFKIETYKIDIELYLNNIDTTVVVYISKSNIDMVSSFF